MTMSGRWARRAPRLPRERPSEKITKSGRQVSTRLGGDDVFYWYTADSTCKQCCSSSFPDEVEGVGDSGHRGMGMAGGGKQARVASRTTRQDALLATSRTQTWSPTPLCPHHVH